MQAVNTKKRRIDISADDEQQLTKILQEGNVTLKSEQFETDRYLDGIIEKPWGREYRIYADNIYDVWKLSLLPGQGTSLHCHPRKGTALLCLSGEGKMQLLGKEEIVSRADIISIEKGVFHSTENIGDSPLELIEIESPRNKLDLIRCADKYGRQGKQYEQQGFDEGMHAIRNGMLVQGSKLRHTCIENKYRFDVQAGMDIIGNPEEHLLFLISLGVIDALFHNIRVFSGSEIEALRPEDLYLTISQYA